MTIIKFIPCTLRGIPVHTPLQFCPAWCPPRSVHVRKRNFFSATLPLSSNVSEIPKLSCKMATLICKGIT